MKKNIMLVSVLLVILVNMFGCGGASTSEQRPNDEVLAGAKTVCGVIHEVDNDTINIQLCGNLFEGTEGDGYMNVVNKYHHLKEGDSVLVYYMGRLDYEDKNGYTEVGNVEVVYVDGYKNDGKFKAHMGIGNLLDGSGMRFAITPEDDEPESQFYVYYISDEEKGIEVKLSDSWNTGVEVTVTYDLNTMEVLSITQ